MRKIVLSVGFLCAVVCAEHAVPPVKSPAPGRSPVGSCPKTSRDPEIAIPTPDDRYPRVMVTTGGGLNVAVFLGELAGALEMGWKPDLIIATCGSGLAGVNLHAMKDPQEIVRLIEEPELLYKMLSLARVQRDQAHLGKVGGLLVPFAVRSNGKGAGLSRLIPDIWAPSVMHIPTDFSKPENYTKIPSPVVGRGFKDEGIRLLIPAARVLYEKNDVDKPAEGWNMYRETFFTDKETAKRLEGMPSFVAVQYPASGVEIPSETITDADLITAARAGISDVMYINPGLVRGEYFAGSAVDLYPLEIAKRLGKEVLMTYSQPVDSFTDMGYEQVFGYSLAHRAKRVANMSADYWIDNSDINELYQSVGFEPKMGFFQDRLVMDGLPTDLEDFKMRNRQLFNWGKARVKEALSRRCSKAHIRNPYHNVPAPRQDDTLGGRKRRPASEPAPHAEPSAARSRDQAPRAWAEERKATRTGAEFTRDRSHPKLGEAWRDSTGMIWGDLVKDTDGDAKWMTHSDAEAYCKSIGAQLPASRDFTRLRESMGAGRGKIEGYEPQVLPNLRRAEKAWWQTRNPDWSFWSSSLDPEKVPYVFLGGEGGITTGGRMKHFYFYQYEVYNAVRCVIPSGKK
jgi:hypothetical protein